MNSPSSPEMGPYSTPMKSGNKASPGKSGARRLNPRDQMKIEKFFSAEKIRKERETKQSRTAHTKGRNTTLKPDIGSTSRLSKRDDSSLENTKTGTLKGVSFYDERIEQTTPHNYMNFISIKEREDN